MKKILIIIMFILLSTYVLADNLENTEKTNFTLSNFIKNEGSEASFAKVLGGLVLAFLLISGVYVFKKKKK